MSSASTKTPITQRLIARAHSPSTAEALYVDKIQHKPLLLRPATHTPPSTSSDARTRRQHIRKVQEEQSRRRKRKPRPLSAKEKRVLGVYDIPKEERKWEIYEGLWKMWCGYIREILNIQPPVEIGLENGNAKTPRKTIYLTPAAAGPNLTSADFHGAKITCVRSRCAGRVGTEGIVVRDTKFTFVVITKTNEIKTLPKEHSIFKFEVPLADNGNDQMVDVAADKAHDQPVFIFELHGEQFKNRAIDRANKKFKMHLPPDL